MVHIDNTCHEAELKGQEDDVEARDPHDSASIQPRQKQTVAEVPHHYWNLETMSLPGRLTEPGLYCKI